MNRCPFCPIFLPHGSPECNDIAFKWLNVGEGNEVYRNECKIGGIGACGPCTQAVLVDEQLREWALQQVRKGMEDGQA